MHSRQSRAATLAAPAPASPCRPPPGARGTRPLTDPFAAAAAAGSDAADRTAPRAYTRLDVAKMISVSLIRDLRAPAILLGVCQMIGTLGYLIIFEAHGDPKPFIDCFYMTSITLTTIGYGDVIGLEGYTVGKVYTIVLGFVGMGIVLYSLGAMASVFVQGNVRRIRERAKLMNDIAELSGHIVVCGVGTTGMHVVGELERSGADFVLIDTNPALEEEWRGHPILHDDATHEDVLEQAGIKRAKGLIACLSHDKDNVLLVLTARILNPNLVIIARGIEAGIPQKLYRAGANYVVVPPELGGSRMALQMLRPHAVSFIDRMLRAKGEPVWVEEVHVRESSPIAGKKILDSRIQEEAGLTVIGLCKPGEDRFIYNPGPDHVLEAGMIILVIGTQAQLDTIERLAGIGAGPAPDVSPRDT